MKKILLSTAAIIAAITTANADSAPKFGGFYLGADVGANMSKIKFPAITTGSAISGANKTGFVYGLFTGYGKSFNSFYAGLELGFGGDSTKHTLAQTDNLATVDVLARFGAATTADAAAANPQTGNTVQHATIKKQYVANFSPRFGYTWGSTMLYVKPGMEYTKYKFTFVQVTTSATTGAVAESDSGTGSKNKWAFAPAIGVEHLFGKVAARAEVAYVSNDLGAGVKNQNYRLVVGAAYQF
jgi:hypothetical protein